MIDETVLMVEVSVLRIGKAFFTVAFGGSNFEVRGSVLNIGPWTCHNRVMPIEDYVSKFDVRLTRVPPSRVRTILQRLRDDLHGEAASKRRFNIYGVRLMLGAELLPAIDEALAEWTRLDDLIVQEGTQRRRIAGRISAFLRFSVGIREQLRRAAHKRRRPLTPAQKVIAAAKLRATRKARGMMGKRQKKKIKGRG